MRNTRCRRLSTAGCTVLTGGDVALANTKYEVAFTTPLRSTTHCGLLAIYVEWYFVLSLYDYMAV